MHRQDSWRHRPYLANPKAAESRKPGVEPYPKPDSEQTAEMSTGMSGNMIGGHT